MDYNLITATDIKQLEKTGISASEVCTQIAFLKNGVLPVKLNRPCRAGDGIVVISDSEKTNLIARHEEASARGRFMKFVPASGAASRMFVQWQSALAKDGFEGEAAAKKFAQNLHKSAFFPELKKVIARHGEEVETLLIKGQLHQILQYILTAKGLNYGHLPKALLKFHVYEDGTLRTALEEHLVEAALYTADANRKSRIHFTVSEEHLATVTRFMAGWKSGYENKFGMTFEIGITCQSRSTNTIALAGGELCRDHAGQIILRPGGHGALLNNLQDLDGDIVFIKNIDNVVPDWLKAEITLYKKVLGGYFLSLEEKIFQHLHLLSSEEAAEKDLRAIKLFCRQKLNCDWPATFDDWTLSEQRASILQRLNRPLRVCGMVKNAGEPGGGPFWVEEQDGLSLQIVESHQIDWDCEQQRDLWAAATHFNPVDLVCGLRDYLGKKFSLPLFADQQAVTLTDKIEHGKKIRVLEHPGLWNGSMSRWNTVFVEVPITTFNPVKTIDDLLRPQHLPKCG